jgi:hypothetical protein
MWIHRTESLTGFAPVELKALGPANWPWRKILADGGLLLAFGLTASWLLRG